MKTEALKTGLWGYKKFSVYQYITALEEEFSAKLLEKDQENHTALEQAQLRIRQLEQELAELHRQHDALRDEHLLISNTLLDAQRYAETLRAQTQEQEQAACKHLEEAVETRKRELEQYDGRLSQLRQLFRTMLQEMDASALEMEPHLEKLREAAPDGNMSLFHRNQEPVA